MYVRVNKNIWRQLNKVVEAEKSMPRPLYDEGDVASDILREYFEREMGVDFDRDPPSKSHVIKTVLELKPRINDLGVVSISLFGSILHGNAKPESDIDFIVDPATTDPYDLDQIGNVRSLLEDRFDRAVDVVTRGAINNHPSLSVGTGVGVESERIF